MIQDELLALRAEIDSVDAQIIELLGQRFQATDKVGHLKADRQLQAVDPSREERQALRYAELASQYGVSDELVLKLFRSVIDEVVKNHQRIQSQICE